MLKYSKINIEGESIMKMLNGYMAGANLGHWISQFKGRTGEEKYRHFDSYIQESDFKRMADWGLDHVRVPVDYFIFENDNNPGVYDENGLKYIDFALECCKKYGLNMVLDLHHAPGFSFSFKYDSERNNLFYDEKQQKRYINIWKMFAKRYVNEKENLSFELLNELVLENSEAWNKLWQVTANEILDISPDRYLIIGSNRWNSCSELKNLVIWDNDNIIYNFHFYEPFIFTHQRASWEKHMLEYKKAVAYPFYIKDHKEFINQHFSDTFSEFDYVGKDFLYKALQPAIDFINRNNRPLYCGEYGVIANADNESAIRWLDDITSIFNEYGIGHAVWSYRGFSNITDDNNNVVSDQMVKLISRK